MSPRLAIRERERESSWPLQLRVFNFDYRLPAAICAFDSVALEVYRTKKNYA